MTKDQPQTPPKGLLGKALNYALNHWPKLIRYLEDGRILLTTTWRRMPYDPLWSVEKIGCSTGTPTEPMPALLSIVSSRRPRPAVWSLTGICASVRETPLRPQRRRSPGPAPRGSHRSFWLHPCPGCSSQNAYVFYMERQGDCGGKFAEASLSPVSNRLRS